MSRKQKELPNVEGPGVGHIRIPEVDAAVDNYEKSKARKKAWGERQKTAEEEVVKHIKANADKIGVNGGVCVYRYEDLEIVVEPGKDKLKVRPAAEEDEE